MTYNNYQDYMNELVYPTLEKIKKRNKHLKLRKQIKSHINNSLKIAKDKSSKVLRSITLKFYKSILQLLKKIPSIIFFILKKIFYATFYITQKLLLAPVWAIRKLIKAIKFTFHLLGLIIKNLWCISKKILSILLFILLMYGLSELFK